jgi:acyl-CoA synthetase (AMP-forming)/AMP-acid ligase II
VRLPAYPDDGLAVADLPRADHQRVWADTEGALGLHHCLRDDPGHRGADRPGGEPQGPERLGGGHTVHTGEDAAGFGLAQPGLAVVPDDRRLATAAALVSVGEIALRGNNVMLGYFKDPEVTAAAAPDGWFRTGDQGVVHPDGYVELRDRIKDIIISGGGNIHSVEVEQAIAAHPAVLEAAVVAAPDDKWGEVPVAYVTLQDGKTATEREIIDHVRARLARFKPPPFVFSELPRTSTGKIQKFVLRERSRRDHNGTEA